MKKNGSEISPSSFPDSSGFLSPSSVMKRNKKEIFVGYVVQTIHYV